MCMIACSMCVMNCIAVSCSAYDMMQHSVIQFCQMQCDACMGSMIAWHSMHACIYVCNELYNYAMHVSMLYQYKFVHAVPKFCNTWVCDFNLIMSIMFVQSYSVITSI